MITADACLDRLRAHARGKQAALAYEAGVSEAYVSRVMNRVEKPGPKLLALIGLRAVTAYEDVA